MYADLDLVSVKIWFMFFTALIIFVTTVIYILNFSKSFSKIAVKYWYLVIVRDINVLIIQNFEI
jgi:hypothetical protein